MARKLPTLERIDSDPRFAAGLAVLRRHTDGLQQVEGEADALRIEDHLAHRPLDPRAPELRERLKKHRGAAPNKRAEPAPSGELPPTVVALLEIIRGARPPRRIDRKTAIAQLEDDRYVIHDAIIAQHAVVDALRDELSFAVSERGRDAPTVAISLHGRQPCVRCNRWKRHGIALIECYEIAA